MQLLGTLALLLLNIWEQLILSNSQNWWTQPERTWAVAKAIDAYDMINQYDEANSEY